MSLFIRSESMGWGNIALCLADLCFHCKHPLVHTSINDVDRGVIFSGIEFTDDRTIEQYYPKLFINNYYNTHIHPIIRQIIHPSDIMKKMIQEHEYLIHGVELALHIRRGAYSNDSSNIGCHAYAEDGTIKKAFFANDIALDKFIKIVETSRGKVFLASDSKDIKTFFKNKFEDRISILDTDIVLTYKCDVLKNYNVDTMSRLNCYLEWFLLSMCPSVYITAGNADCTDFSTFGYSAAVYGNKPTYLVTNTLS